MIAYSFLLILVISGILAAPIPVATHQSPINIITDDVENAKFTPIMNYGKIRNLNTAKIVNTGKTVRIEASDEEFQAIITGGPMNDQRFKFLEAHFHWGENDKVGCETQIDGKISPLELHMVFYNTKYLNKATALEMHDGLVVLATLYEVSTQSSTILSFVERFDEIVKSGQSMEFPFDDRNFAYFLPITSNSYYTYHGSLTTAPYNEAVTWVVFKQPMPITESQLEKFRTLTNDEGEPIANNFRSIQKTNERTVYQNTFAVDLLYFLFEFGQYALYTDA